jgi:uncharacterized protein (DUF488 family)
MIHTIGHSTLTFEAFAEMLRAFEIHTVADVRRFPGSRRHPQYSNPQFQSLLAEAGIAYEHLPELGGRRSGSRTGSPNTGWRNPSFRAYADHLASEEFRRGIDRLLALERAAVMCAEAVPWRCHRNLISDYLVAHRVEVEHILSPTESRPHELNPLAEVDEQGGLTYPSKPGQRSLLSGV